VGSRFADKQLLGPGFEPRRGLTTAEKDYREDEFHHCQSNVDTVCKVVERSEQRVSAESRRTDHGTLFENICVGLNEAPDLALLIRNFQGFSAVQESTERFVLVEQDRLASGLPNRQVFYHADCMLSATVLPDLKEFVSKIL
jgi:hypothetical protein